MKLLGTTLLFIGIVICLLPSVARTQQAAAPKRILLLNWGAKDFPGNVMFDQSFLEVIQASPEWTEYYPEYLDTNRFPGEAQARFLHDYLEKKYADTPIDVVVALGDPTLDFLLKYRDDLFPTAPIVFFANKPPPANQLAVGPGVTGFIHRNAYRETLDLALGMHPHTEQVFVVSGSLIGDKTFENACRQDLEGYEGRATINYLTDLRPEELTLKMKSLPERSIVLYLWQQANNERGRLLETEDMLDLVVGSASVPVYGLSSWELGRGIVGGYVRTIETNGARGARLALRIANGARAQDIPVENLPVTPMFDWAQLKRWGISEASLPPGNIVRFRVPSVWDQYRWYGIALFAVIVGESLLIAGLVANRRRRKRAEEERGQAQAEEAETRARLAGVIGSAMDAIVSTDESQRIVLFNDAAQKMFGWTESEVIGQTIDCFIPARFRESHHRHVNTFGETSITTRAMGSLGAIWGCRSNGEEFPIEASISHLELRGHKFYTVILRDITERTKTEEALRELQESLTIALEASQMGTWDLDLTRDFSGHRNLRHDQIFGYDEPQANWGREVARRHIVEEDREIFDAAFARAMATGSLDFDVRVRWPDQSIHWMAARGRIYFDEKGQPNRGAGVNFDITGHKEAEEALRESEVRFRNMADTAPVMIWISGVDKLCTYFNEQWLNFTGRPIEEELGNGWTNGVHADDYERCLDTYTTAFDRRETFKMEYRLRRADGQFRWVYDTGVARFSPGGKFLGYIGSCIEITERREAEDALRKSEEALRESYNHIEDLAGRLIVAQEEERKHIARELHDDLHQQVAALAIGLDLLGRQLPESNGPVREQLSKLEDATAKLSDWIRKLSHELHSSILQYLGLEEALKLHCENFTEQQGIAVSVNLNGRIGDVPPDVALCLDRVAQEALRNIAKHSGAKRAELSLVMNNGSIELRISDQGNGFDLEARRGQGLGLVSMEERTKLLGGKLEIKSEPGVGTQLSVIVPVKGKL